MFSSLVNSCKTVDHVFVFRRDQGLTGFLRLVSDIRRHQFDWVIDLQGLFRSGLICFLSKGRHKAGRVDAREGARIFYKKIPPLPETGKKSHALEILLQFSKLLGLQPELKGNLQFNGSLPPQLAHELGKTIPNLRTILFFPQSRRIEKEWPFFGELTSKLLKNCSGIRIVWAASSKIDAPLGLPVDQFLNFSGRTPIECLPALIGTVDLVLANDSGPMHLAVALGKTVAALFGPTDTRRFGPYDSGNNVHRTIQAPEGNLSKLSPNLVQSELLSMLP